MKRFTIDFSAKRTRLALRFFTYGVMTLTTVVCTALAIFYAMGYRLNQNDLTFQQGGLMQFRSFPSSARVTVNGKQQNFTTPGRLNANAGEHEVVMALDGYRPWQKRVHLAAGQLLWLNYPRLMLETITTTSMVEFETVHDALISPNRRWVAVLPQASAAQISLTDTANEDEPVTTTVPLLQDALTKKDGVESTFRLKEWDLGSRYLLIEHTIGDVRELLRFDRQNPEQLVNVSQVFGLPIGSAHFAGSNPNTLYVETNGVLRSLDLSSSVASAVLVADIERFTMFGNETVAFVAKRQSENGVQQRIAGFYRGGKHVDVRAFDAEDTVRVAYTEYTRQSYFAVTSGDGNVRILRNPSAEASEQAVAADITFGEPVQWMRFSDNGRMLAIGAGSKVAVYDLELAKLYNWQAHAELQRPLQWLDDYYLWSDAGDRLHIYEFDNANSREITALASGYSVSLSQDNKYVYSFTATPTGFALQRSHIVR